MKNFLVITILSYACVPRNEPPIEVGVPSVQVKRSGEDKVTLILARNARTCPPPSAHVSYRFEGVWYKDLSKRPVFGGYYLDDRYVKALKYGISSGCRGCEFEAGLEILELSFEKTFEIPIYVGQKKSPENGAALVPSYKTVKADKNYLKITYTQDSKTSKDIILRLNDLSWIK